MPIWRIKIEMYIARQNTSTSELVETTHVQNKPVGLSADIKFCISFTICSLLYRDSPFYSH